MEKKTKTEKKQTTKAEKGKQTPKVPSLADAISKYLLETPAPKTRTLQDIYGKFPDADQHLIRGALYQLKRSHKLINPKRSTYATFQTLTAGGAKLETAKPVNAAAAKANLAAAVKADLARQEQILDAPSLRRR